MQRYWRVRSWQKGKRCQSAFWESAAVRLWTAARRFLLPPARWRCVGRFFGQGLVFLTSEPLPLGVIVTVAGTGSECNGGAVITNEDLKIKTGRDYPKCNPKFGSTRSDLYLQRAEKQMVSGSFDILSHIMETYFSEPNEDNVSDDISEALSEAYPQPACRHSESAGLHRKKPI